VKPAALLVTIAVGLLAGCGGDDQSTSQARVYFLRDGKVWPVLRTVEDEDVTTALTTALAEGPTDQEKADLSLTTAVPSSEGDALSNAALAQLVYTRTQFPDVRSVEIDGKRYTRADFEEQTPLILVESPLAYDEVSSPLRATGTANTFEATFQYELKDGDGNVVDEHFVTATSGTGTRGTFDFTTKPFDDVGSLVVFELSAKDGSRVNEVEIPLRTSR
jgi:Immunoglobulin-like domain of bacterial spore germination